MNTTEPRAAEALAIARDGHLEVVRVFGDQYPAVVGPSRRVLQEGMRVLGCGPIQAALAMRDEFRNSGAPEENIIKATIISLAALYDELTDCTAKAETR